MPLDLGGKADIDLSTDLSRFGVGAVFIRKLQRFVQVRIWGMDIHPSAKIATTALIDRTFPQGVHIGADVQIGEQATVMTHDIVTRMQLHTYIREGATIGARAIVLPGRTIGRGAAVLPGAVVTRDVADGTTVCGNPGSVVAPMLTGPQTSMTIVV